MARRNNLTMSIKLSLLKTGETVISDIKEIISDDKPCGYIFENPYKILTERSILLTEESEYDAKIQVSLSPWILLTEDDKILVSLDSVVTVVEPLKSVKEMYEEKVNGKNNQVSFTES